MSKPPHSQFDTSVLPREHQFGAWQEAIGVLFDTRSAVPREHGFQARVDAYLCGETGIGMIDAQAQHYDRSRYKLGRDGMDTYVLQYYLEGSCIRRDGGIETATRPGDLFIVDAAQPLTTSTTDSRFLSLVVPRRLLTPLLQSPDELSMRVLRGDAPMIGLLRDHLCSLYHSVGQLSDAEAQAVIPGTLQLAAAAVNSQVTESNVRAVYESLFAAVCRHINRNLADLTISPESVAFHFGTSRATLYRLFEREGGFLNYVRTQRLRQCYAILADRSQIHRPIAEIARTYGYSDASNFTRAYRRAIGMSPRETRALAEEGRAATLPFVQDGDWRTWLAHMR
ncbi:helix-turn-helix domain-containing protein [Ralstonia sp. UBA689]|uniref:AraC-like ligand-binding domain-containing protein n=1 Tax=Ralstonia sp. UBA689 TaxID=1947373 RepID=UPI0025D190B3|nr:helix-turn-helix domain-containing protein [Ralstonia sp. UBA689]